MKKAPKFYQSHAGGLELTLNLSLNQAQSESGGAFSWPYKICSMWAVMVFRIMETSEKKSGQKKLELICLWSQNNKFIKAQWIPLLFSIFPTDYCSKIWLFSFVWILIWNLERNFLSKNEASWFNKFLFRLFLYLMRLVTLDRLQSPDSSAGQQRTISYRIKPKYFQDCFSVGRWDTIY